MLGDGSLTKKYNYLQVSIESKDVSVLLNFCKWLNYPDSKIKFYTRLKTNSKIEYRTSVYMVISNKIMKSQINKFGICHNKTTSPILPNLTKDEFLPFLLGLLDADGCVIYEKVSFRKNGKIRVDNEINLVGHKVIMTWVQNELEKYGFYLFKQRSAGKNKDITRLSITKKIFSNRIWKIS